MRLIERTQPNYLQSYLSTSCTSPENEVKNLIKLNLLSRFFRSVKNELTEDEINNRTLPKIRIKVIRVKPKNLDSHLYVGNITHKMGSNIQESEVSDNVVNEFNRSGVELPSRRILSDRLNSFSAMDIEDPFRLSNIDIDVLDDIDVRDVDYSYLENSETEFEDRMFAGLDYEKNLFYSKIKATCIILINDKINKDPNWRLDPMTADKLVRDIENPEFKKDVKDHIMRFYKDPSVREEYLKDANKVLNNTRDAKDKKGKPIPTWKIIAAVSVIILGVLAYTKRSIFTNSIKYTRDQKEHGNKKASFIKNMLTKNGRSEAKEFVNLDKIENSSNKSLSDIPNQFRELKVKESNLRNTIEKARIGKDRLRNKYLNK